MFLNPKNEQFAQLDPQSREIMRKTIAFFEKKGKVSLKDDEHNRVWYRDFLDFIKENKIFATLLTPPAYAETADGRWDTYRNTFFNEILGFYGLYYWYTWQVTILGLGPIWMSKNEKLKKKAARMLAAGGIFGFGLSEKKTGADIRANSTELTRNPDGGYTANGHKYYIGNGNEAALLSTQGKIKDSGEFVFFAVETTNPAYKCVKNTVDRQAYVAEYTLTDYRLTEDDMLSTGRDAWDSALNTVNVGKWNLGWASIGMCTHSFYESITHAANRYIFGRYVTDFPHIQKLFVDAYARLAAMKLFATRACDYMRTANPDDRRYLLYDPMVKMYVTTQGEDVINLLWDVIAARGFEKDMYFEGSARDIRALPKLEGTVHVNMVLVIRFIKSYFSEPAEYPAIGRQREPKNDDFLFKQGSSQKGLNQIGFHDFRKPLLALNLPNVNIFLQQVDAFIEFMRQAEPDKEQSANMDFMLTVGMLFAQVPYASLIAELAQLENTDRSLISQILDFIIRDFSRHAIELYGKNNATAPQRALALKMVAAAAPDTEHFRRVFNDMVMPLKGAYEMNA